MLQSESHQCGCTPAYSQLIQYLDHFIQLVSDVVIGAPAVVTQGFIERFGIHVVVQSAREEHHAASLGGHSYEVPKKLGILQTVDSGNETTTEQIIERVLAKRHLFDTAEPPDGR
ncbi:ethanolamine-phosphate cytidylyltransferase-like protein [Aphelenchoides avenae]|nr:ethanolamine-phosphate cytidylyltransferase-like protein [Aphelenchus avenae]